MTTRTILDPPSYGVDGFRYYLAGTTHFGSMTQLAVLSIGVALQFVLSCLDVAALVKSVGSTP